MHLVVNLVLPHFGILKGLLLQEKGPVEKKDAAAKEMNILLRIRWPSGSWLPTFRGVSYLFMLSCAQSP